MTRFSGNLFKYAHVFFLWRGRQTREFSNAHRATLLQRLRGQDVFQSIVRLTGQDERLTPLSPQWLTPLQTCGNKKMHASLQFDLHLQASVFSGLAASGESRLVVGWGSPGLHAPPSTLHPPQPHSGTVGEAQGSSTSGLTTHLL